MFVYEIEFQQQRPLASFSYRLVEGITSLMMPLGFVHGGGEVISVLFVFYVLHFMASFRYHVHPSALTYLCDTSMINLLIMERGYLKTKNMMVCVVLMASVLMERVKSHKWVVVRAGVVCLLGDISVMYISMWFMVAMCYGSSVGCAIGFPFWSSLTCALYHVFLGFLSAIEVGMYPEYSNNPWRLVCYFLFFLDMLKTVKNV